MTADSKVKTASPTPDDLAALLGPAFRLWLRLRDDLLAGDGRVAERWVYGGAKYGWSCRLERSRKGILYMTPDSDHFRVGLALSDAGRDAALSSELPDTIRQGLAATPRAMEGWPVRMPVRTEGDLELVFRLAAIKQST
jgi:hypothetical protein